LIDSDITYVLCTVSRSKCVWERESSCVSGWRINYREADADADDDDNDDDDDD